MYMNKEIDQVKLAELKSAEEIDPNSALGRVYAAAKIAMDQKVKDE